MTFADDTVVFSESREQVEDHLERWRFDLEKEGMKFSCKTEHLGVNERNSSGVMRLQGAEAGQQSKTTGCGDS